MPSAAACPAASTTGRRAAPSCPPNNDGTFAWFNGDEEGTATSFGAAWAEMPAMVAEPDYCEDLDADPETRP